MTPTRRLLLSMLGAAALAWLGYQHVRGMRAQHERLEEVDRRIESMLPKPKGDGPTPVHADAALTLTLTLSRRDAEDDTQAHTVIQVGDDAKRFTLPRGWRGRATESAQRIETYDATLARVRAAVAAKLAAHGGAPEDAKGEIHAPPPHGAAVPHGDVVALLNVFLGLGMVDVVFEGAAAPASNAERAARVLGGDGR